MIHKVCPWSLKIRLLYVFERFDACKGCESDSFFLSHKIFSSTLGQDLILEFTKEMFAMKEFEQVSWMSLSVFLCTSVSL